ncbi:Rab-39 [Intoshia linei]|uniref:Rab-39 n=1 Tax=Intoshia linei TaxID=1819745 RepID=A0A177B9Z5_9BILA|nr:Rab-39 [Intoshia linei]
MVAPIFKYQFRFILIGDSTVGKTSLLRYLCTQQFVLQEEATIGVDFHATLLEIEPNLWIKLQIWDTAGQEKFRAITAAYYRNAVVVIIVFDISNRKSFDNITEWYNEACKYTKTEETIYALCGQKMDLHMQRQISTTEANDMADYLGIPYFEVSAREGNNVVNLFTTLSKTVYRSVENGNFIIRPEWSGVIKGFMSHQNQIASILSPHEIVLDKKRERRYCC